MFIFNIFEQFSIEIYSSVIIPCGLNFVFLSVIWSSRHNIFIYNKLENLLIILFNFVCKKPKNKVFVKKYSFYIFVYIFAFLHRIIGVSEPGVIVPMWDS